MPHGRLLRALQLADVDVVEEVRHLEEPRHDNFDLEVLLQFLLGVGVLVLSEPRRVEGLVPRLKRLDRALRRRLELGLFLGGDLLGRRIEVVNHLHHRRDRRRALHGDRKFRRVLETEQLRLLEAEGENLVDPRGVLWRARRAGAEELLAHLAVGAVLHRLRIVCVVDRVGLAVLLELERVRRVEDGVGVVHRKLREALGDFVEALFLLALERDTGELRVLDRLFENPYARRVLARAAARLEAHQHLLRQVVETL